MPNNAHLMVDIETMDVLPTAAIVAIGAVVFDPYEQNEISEFTNTFSVRISLKSNQLENRTMSADTIQWWMTQSQEAREATFTGDQMNLGQALREFNQWVARQPIKPVRVWAKDPDFDCVILQDAMRQCRERWPFNFWESRSIRTAQDLAYPDGERPALDFKGIKHDALSDALMQCVLLQQCYHLLAIGQ